jgi:tetratricopeptide (TPR) repeat protein
MSAVAPLPEPEPATGLPGRPGGPSGGPSAGDRPDRDNEGVDGDDEGWALLESLRRRLDEQGALGRKTATQVSQLAESIAALVEIQRRRVRWLNLNSFVAYVLFTVLVGAGAFALYQSRARELISARDEAAGSQRAAGRRADEVDAKAAARDAAEAQAWQAYQLLVAGKRAEAGKLLPALAGLPLSRIERAVLSERAEQGPGSEADGVLRSAAAAFRAGKHAEVIEPLKAALVGEPDGPRAAQLRYFLGVALAKVGDLEGAISHLGAAVAADVEQEDARFQLASALDRSGAAARARAEYDRFATAHPQSPLAVFAMRRSATLAHGGSSGGPSVGPPAGATPRPPIKPPVPGAGGPGAAGGPHPAGAQAGSGAHVAPASPASPAPKTP